MSAVHTTTLLTVGHSTHDAETFVGLLERHQVETLIDIRRYPGSRRYPHFNREHLAQRLAAAGIDYQWFESLGGRRHTKKTDPPSPNTALRNAAFRSYADYMSTEDFRAAVDRVLETAQQRRTAIMCSEGLFWRCHRRLVSDYVLAAGHAVYHIFPDGALKPHVPTEGLRVDNGRVWYPGDGEGMRG